MHPIFVNSAHILRTSSRRFFHFKIIFGIAERPLCHTSIRA